MLQSFNTLLQTFHQYKLLPPDATVLVAVSGGADSLALLHFLATHRAKLNISLHCATLNHNLRPTASDDVAFVERFANSLNVPFTIGFADVPAIADENNLGIEASARLARYNFLAETAQNLNITHIATAHHADDQSETILMHILRGSGLQGLQGMQMKTDLPYHPHLTLIRPLLTTRRAEIDAYCTEHHLKPRIDLSNFDTEYLRNEIRHEILPRLRQINPQLDGALAKLADIASTEQEFMAQIYQRYFKHEVIFADRVSLSLATFQDWHLALQRYFLRDVLNYFEIEPSFEQIGQAIQTGLRGQVASISEFSSHHRLRIGYDMLYIEPTNLPLPIQDYIQIEQEYNLEIPSEITLGDYQLSISDEKISDYTACLSIPENATVYLRPRQAGDRFQPQGLGGHSQKIKKFMIDNKIPSHIRDRIPLLIVNNVIAGIVLPDTWRIGESFIKNEISQRNIYFKVKKL